MIVAFFPLLCSRRSAPCASPARTVAALCRAGRSMVPRLSVQPAERGEQTLSSTLVSTAAGSSWTSSRIGVVCPCSSSRALRDARRSHGAHGQHAIQEVHDLGPAVRRVQLCVPEVLAPHPREAVGTREARPGVERVEPIRHPRQPGSPAASVASSACRHSRCSRTDHSRALAIGGSAGCSRRDAAWVACLPVSSTALEKDEG